MPNDAKACVGNARWSHPLQISWDNPPHLPHPSPPHPSPPLPSPPLHPFQISYVWLFYLPSYLVPHQIQYWWVLLKYIVRCMSFSDGCCPACKKISQCWSYAGINYWATYKLLTYCMLTEKQITMMALITACCLLEYQNELFQPKPYVTTTFTTT